MANSPISVSGAQKAGAIKTQAKIPDPDKLYFDKDGGELVYTVKAGDTLSGILVAARRKARQNPEIELVNNADMDFVVEQSQLTKDPIYDKNKIKVGQKIRIHTVIHMESEAILPPTKEQLAKMPKNEAEMVALEGKENMEEEAKKAALAKSGSSPDQSKSTQLASKEQPTE